MSGPADIEERRHFAPNAAHLVRTTQQIHVQLSQMADQKASILMGATFVIFTIAIGQARGGHTALPLLILGGFAFLSAVFAILAVLPATRTKDTEPVNLLFFGSFIQFDEDEYVARLMDVMGADETVYRTMARDIYQNGAVLARKKYRLLGYAYRILLTGLISSAVAFVFVLGSA